MLVNANPNGSKAAAAAVASMMAEMIRVEGDDCELLIHEDEDWHDGPCPEAPQPAP